MTTDISEHESMLSQERAAHFAKWLSGMQYTPRNLADVGCRCGFALMILADALPDTELIGVDILPEVLDRALNYCEHVVCADVTQGLPFEDKSIDWAFCSHTLEHMYDIPAAIRELARITSYGMHIVVPLESDAKFEYYKGKSSPDGDAGMHQFHTMDPFVWLDMFRGTGMILRNADMSIAHSDLRFTLMHPDKLLYGGNVYS